MYDVVRRLAPEGRRRLPPFPPPAPDLPDDPFSEPLRFRMLENPGADMGTLAIIGVLMVALFMAVKRS